MKSILVSLLLLLSIQAFSADDATPYLQQSTYLNMEISPDGKLIAAISFDGEEYAIVFLDSTSLEVVDVMKFRYPDTVGPFRWVNNERIVLNVFQYIYREDGFFTYGELYSMKVKDTRGKFIFGYRAGKDAFGSSKEQSIAAKHRNFSRAWNEVIDILEHDPKHILVAATPWSADRASNTHIYKINVDDGNIFPVTILDKSYARVVTDGKGNIVAAYRYKDNFDTEVLSYHQDTDEWKTIESLQNVTDFSFEYYDVDRKQLVFTSRFKSDKAALYAFDFATNEVTELFSHHNVDVFTTLSASKIDTAYSVLTLDGKPGYTPINQSNPLTALFAAMVNGFKGHRVEIISASVDKQKVIFSLQSDTRAPEFYLFDASVGRPTLIAKANDKLSSLPHSALLPLEVKRKEAVNIPGYISLPKDLSSPVPVLVMINRNPHTRRFSWGFDRYTQMYVSRGYAVVKLNLPGSNGYGRAYDEIGINQWNIHSAEALDEALSWIGKTYPVDISKACLMGNGWGAYSAVMAARYHKDKYRCVVAQNGFYDFDEYREESHYDRFAFGHALMDRDFGADQTALTALNLENHISELNTPVLFVHDEYASVQSLSSVEDLVEAMQKGNIEASLFEKKRTSRAPEALEVDLKAQDAIFKFIDEKLK